MEQWIKCLLSIWFFGQIFSGWPNDLLGTNVDKTLESWYWLLMMLKCTNTNTYVRVSGGKKCSFFGKFGVLYFLETPVLRLAFLPYYQRFISYFERIFFHLQACGIALYIFLGCSLARVRAVFRILTKFCFENSS